MHEPPDCKERQHPKQINIEKDDQKSKQLKAEKEKQLKKDKKYKKHKKNKKTNHILTRLVELLKASYSKNPFIERLFYPDNPLPLEQCYLHLALTQEIKVKTSNAEKESNKEKERIREEADEATHERSDRKNKERIIGDNPLNLSLRQYERIETIQRKIEVKALLSEAKETPKHIYIEGTAGSGKSTLSRYIVHQWCLDKAPWNQYQCAFYIRLRELTDSKYTEKKMQFLEVIQRECFKLGLNNNLTEKEQEFLLKYLRKHPQQVLFVLDGLDELQLNNYTQAFWDDLIHSSHDILITSRFGAQVNKRDLLISLNLAVLGFSDEQVKQYINNFFDPNTTPEVKKEDGQNCLNLLQTQANLWSLAHTPIQLELLCSIWDEEFKQHQNDINLTYLYRLIFEKLLKRSEQLYLFKQKRKTVSLNNIDIKPLKAKWQNYIKYMEHLAFLGISKKSIILSKEDMNEAYGILPSPPSDADEFYQQLRELGLLRRFNDGKQVEFIHLTFQEFFAARYIAKAIKAFCEGVNENKLEKPSHKALLEFIKQNKWDLFYEVMWWFVAGLLAGKRIQNQKLELYQYRSDENIDLRLPKTHIRLQRLQAFFDLLLQEPRNQLKICEVCLLSRCLDVARYPNIMQNKTIQLHMEKWYKMYFHMIIKNGYSIRCEVIDKIKNTLIYNNDKTFLFNELLEMIKKEDILTKHYGIMGMLEISSNCTLEYQLKIIDPLLLKIEDNDTWFIESAIDLWQKIILNFSIERRLTIFDVFLLKLSMDDYEILYAILAIPRLIQFLPGKNQKKIINMVIDVLKGKFLRPFHKKWFVNALKDIFKAVRPKLKLVIIDGLLDFIQLTQDRAINDPLYFMTNTNYSKDIDHTIYTLIELSKSPLAKQSLRMVDFFCQQLENRGIYSKNNFADSIIKSINIVSKNITSNSEASLFDKKSSANDILKSLIYIIEDEEKCKLFHDLFHKLLDSILYDNDALLYILEKYSECIPSKNNEEIIKLLFRIKEDRSNNDVTLFIDKVLIRFGVIPKIKEANTKHQMVGSQLLKKKPNGYIEGVLHDLKNIGWIGYYVENESLIIIEGMVRNDIKFKLINLIVSSDEHKCKNAIKILNYLEYLFPNESACYFEDDLKGLLISQNNEIRLKLIKLILIEVKKIPINFVIYCINQLFPDQPFSIPPSRLISLAKDIVKVDDKGKLQTLTLCGEVMESIIKNNQETHLISQDFWTISIVRKRDGARNDNASPGFFKQIKFTNGLFDHAFIVIEGVNQNVRFAKKVDLCAVKNKGSQSRGQQIEIDVADINDFKRLEKLAENCSCMVQGISRQKIEYLEEIIKRDQAAAERGEILYNIKGDGSLSRENRDKKEHSCISWCLEKWQEIGLPLQRKWYDSIVVVPKAYLPEPESQNEKCLTM